MKLFGLTGGIGMGKSTAARFLIERGIPLEDTDLLARQVVEPGQPAFKEIQREFGDAVIAPDGQLRRDALARIVFSNLPARQKLESITHPRIRELWKQRVEDWRACQTPLACVVIPLLFETGAEGEFDATICVACSPATQLKRLRERGWPAEQIAQRIAAQFPVEKKMAKATFAVWNEGGLDVLRAQLDVVFTSSYAARV